jgi:hypothetical protein
MSRFFVDPSDVTDKYIYLNDSGDLKHMRKVLRMGVGDELDISDGAAWEYHVQIEALDEDEAKLLILDKQKFAREPELHVTLYQGVPKAGKMEGIIQKCVELGVHAIMYDADLTCEVNVVAYETVETDFDELTEHGAAMMAANFEYSYRDQGYDVTSVALYEALDGHKFIRSITEYIYDDGYTEYKVEYLTCQAGYTVLVVMFTFDGPASEAHMAMSDAIADSLWITPIN